MGFLCLFESFILIRDYHVIRQWDQIAVVVGELRGLSEMSLSQVVRVCSITSQKSTFAGRRCLVLLSLLIVFVSYTFGSNYGGRTLLSPAAILLSH